MPEVEEEANRVLEEQVNNVAEGVQEVMDNNSENKNIEVSSEQDVDVKPVQEEQKVENDINSEKIVVRQISLHGLMKYLMQLKNE